MNTPKKVITISREFGSGGRTIAKDVAEKMGYAYYDKELIKEVAEKTGFDPKYVEENSEDASGAPLFSFTGSVLPGTLGAMDGMSTADYLWVMQRRIILDLAQKGNCVIVGRCADYILKERTDTLNVFIHADLSQRAERIVRLYGDSEVKPEERLKTKDKKRKANYKHYTEREWGDSHNYDLCLDSGRIGLASCSTLIVALAKGVEDAQEK